jgi:hypothetical protein
MLWEVAGIRVSRKWLINVAVALGILGILSVVLYATPFGRSMRACAVNPVGAALAGIPVRATWFATYILGGLLAGIAGILILNTTGMDYSNGLGFTGGQLRPEMALAHFQCIADATDLPIISRLCCVCSTRSPRSRRQGLGWRSDAP